MKIVGYFVVCTPRDSSVKGIGRDSVAGVAKREYIVTMRIVKIEVFIMKKALIFSLCLLTVFSMSACKKGDAVSDSAISSDVYQDESLVGSDSQSTTTTTGTNSTKTSSTKKTTSTTKKNSHTTATAHAGVTSNTTRKTTVEESTITTKQPHVKDDSYRDIVCAEILEFQQVSFSVKNSNALVFVTMPKEWKLEKNQNGYSIVKGSRVIGSVATSAKTSTAVESVNVFYGEITADDLKITHSIDRIDSHNERSYSRTLRYNYVDESGSDISIVLTVPYQEIDSSAVYKMMSGATKSVCVSDNKMGVLKIQDNRNKVLILGNSFVASSSIGEILQRMCGYNMSVEAHSRGYANVGTYASDDYMLQNIRAGKYSAVFMCGFYSYGDVLDLRKIVDACEDSDTKLVIFPAHNEDRSHINDAVFMYPDAVLIDWKAEIDTLISAGIAWSNFCIPDTHSHSTPLAGYVGAHMIYRAIFNVIPQTTYFSQVSQSEINLLGEYTTSGTITLLDTSSAYVIE